MESSRGRRVEKRGYEQGVDDEADNLPESKKAKLPALASVIVEALKVDSLQRLCSSLEPLFRRIVSEEVERALTRLGPAKLAGGSSPPKLPGPNGNNLQLHFRTRMPPHLFTGGKVEGERGATIHVVLLDASTGTVMQTGTESAAKLNVVVLEGDFNDEADEGWTAEHFESHEVKEREGKRPLLTGDLQVSLKEGVGTLGELTFTDNSSWIRSRKFRLGVKVSPGYCEGIRVREAKTEAFAVKDHRGELYKKHYPPALQDEVWRLDRIAKDGALHKKLVMANITTVEDFLRVLFRDSQNLRNILGSGMSNRMWENTVEHAKTCVLGGKLYVYYAAGTHSTGVVFTDVYEPRGLISDGQFLSLDSLNHNQKISVDSLVKRAYENWHQVVEYDGKVLNALASNKGGKGASAAPTVDNSFERNQYITSDQNKQQFIPSEPSSQYQAINNCLAGNWWSRISEGLPKGNGSSVIITTRFVEVLRKMEVNEARMHQPNILNDNNSWLLFSKIAFAASGGECTKPELEKIGKEIVQKCNGLPLAIKAIGGMLLYKSHYHEWKRIADNFRDELGENDDTVMPSLQLSYDELPPYLKSCFLSFSLYPEDCVVTKEQLVHWWIGEGFVPLRSGRPSTEAGEDCFSGLTNRCLVEVVEKTYNGTIHTCKIHDMVRELVIKMAENDAFFKDNCRGCRHFGIDTKMDPKQLAANHKLRALLSTTKTGEVNKISSSIANKFSECKYLRVLDLCKSIFEMSLTSLLSHIGFLQHLTYLSLSNTHPLTQLPPSLENLKNLEILNVSYSQNLKVLPPYLTKFKKLRVLDVSHCGSLEYLPKGLGRLSNLEVLLGFRPARASQLEGCRIAELRNLSRLRKLGLHLVWDDEIGDSEVSALVNLQQLQFLTISCFDSHGSGLVDKLDKLYPPPELHELCLQFYPGKLSPAWLNPISLHMLRYLWISSGNLAKMHGAFFGENNSGWKIEGLMLETLSDLEMEWQMVQQVMPSLKILNASWCPNLVSFPIEDVGFRGGVWTKGEHRR